MTVWLNTQRKAVVVGFNAVHGETFNIRATREEEEVHSSGPHKNQSAGGDNNTVVTFPADFSGLVHVEITGSDGSRSEGDINIE